MSKELDMTREEAEEYELQPSASPSSPLLPSYTPHLTDRSSSPPLSLGIKKTRHPHPRHGSSYRAFRAVGILCAVVTPCLLATALIGCMTGQGRDVLQGLKNWEGVPQDVKDWLEGMGKGYESVGDQGMFPTNIGYAGPTPTGKEPGLLATAPSPPHHTALSPLLPPTPHNHHPKTQIQNLWGNLSPYHSVTHGLGDSSSLIPQNCELTELHWLQRHGARYPTSIAGGPADFGGKLKAMKGWKAKGELGFLNDWEWTLGAEVLTPFGREQLFDLGVAARVKYGFLLDKMQGRLPVFRTESQDRMLKSAQNFAAGFFGIPAEHQYNLEVTIEAPGYNNTLAPWNTCYNADWNSTGVREKLHEWDEIYLKDARKRLQKDIRGIELTIQDIRMMMDVCPYETVALGYSSFCSLFTEKEWKGYEYRWDLYWWWSSSFGLPSARAQGLGWAQELVSRLTHKFDSTTNSSFHNDIQFPLNDALYVDFTHDTQFALLLPTLNLTSFAEAGPLPSDHMPKHRSFVASEIMPFATNMQIQVLQCGVSKGKDEDAAEDRPNETDSEDDKEEIGETKEEEEQESEEDESKGLPSRVQNRIPARRGSGEKKIRIILNDGVVPLTGIRGCPQDEDGLCPFDAFVGSIQELIGEVDFVKDCRRS